MGGKYYSYFFGFLAQKKICVEKMKDKGKIMSVPTHKWKALLS